MYMFMVSMYNMTRYFTSSVSIVTSRRRVEIQSTSEMTPYITMTKCNKLEKWFPLRGERGRSSYFRCFQKKNREEGETE